MKLPKYLVSFSLLVMYFFWDRCNWLFYNNWWENVVGVEESWNSGTAFSTSVIFFPNTLKYCLKYLKQKFHSEFSWRLQSPIPINTSVSRFITVINIFQSQFTLVVSTSSSWPLVTCNWIKSRCFVLRYWSYQPWYSCGSHPVF